MGQANIFDRQPNFSGGMDSFQYAADLPPNQSQLLQNFIVLDNGRAVTRPGADSLAVAPNPGNPVQGLAFLDRFAGTTANQYLLMGQGGKLYSWNGATWSGSLAFSLASANVQLASAQGVDKLLISDGNQHMQLWDGTNFTDLGGASNINGPVGATALAFIAGMFVAAGEGGLVQGSGSTQYPPDTLFFSNYLNGGVGQWSNLQSFRVGNGDGEEIIGLCPVQTTASSYPIYNLAVLKRNSIWLVGIAPGAYNNSFSNMFASFQATPQGDQVGTGIGCVGSRAFCAYQNDLLFMSQDGVQSLQRMQAAAGQYQLATPLSRPIQPFIDRINWSFAQYVQAVKYRQWAIFFVPLDNSVVNNYALVWDGKIGQWYIWTGWTPAAAVVTRFPAGTRFTNGSSESGIQLIMGNSTGTVTLWKDADDLQYSTSTYLDDGQPIANQQINTRSFIFGSLDFAKKPDYAVVLFNQGNAAATVSAFFDTAQGDTFNQAISPSGVTFPIRFPVTFGSNQPVEAYRDLKGLPYFKEMYISISTNSGWLDCRQVLVAAWKKPIRNPNA